MWMSQHVFKKVKNFSICNQYVTYDVKKYKCFLKRATQGVIHAYLKKVTVKIQPGCLLKFNPYFHPRRVAVDMLDQPGWFSVVLRRIHLRL